MKLLKRSITLTATTALLVTGGLLGASTATAGSAAYGACSTTTTVGGVTVPAAPAPWVSPTAKTTSCSISPLPYHVSAQSPGLANLQRHIRECYGLYAGNAGSYDAQFISALRTVQAQIGDPVDGVYGPSTRDRMKFKPNNGGACVTVASTD